MAEWPRSIPAWECSDGTHCFSKQAALDHQRSVDAAASAQVLLDGGATLDKVLRAFYEHRYGMGAAEGIVANIKVDALSLTHRSLLVISHWQCLDEPVYRIERILPSGSFWVWGTKPGPLGNTYGHDVSVRDLESYAAETLRRCGAVPCEEVPC